MRAQTIKRLQIYVSVVVALSTCFFTENSFATTHVIMFGGTLGFVFSPNSFSASVGDSVKWEGDFSVHPLSSTTIPAAAASWLVTSGTEFTYDIKVAGTYHYQCNVHFSIGMVGSFTVAATPVNGAQLYPQHERFNMKNISLQGKDMVQFTIPNSGNVIVNLFDMRGEKVSTILSRSLPAGSHQAVFGPFPAGLYCLKLNAAGNSLVQEIQLVK